MQSFFYRYLYWRAFVVLNWPLKVTQSSQRWHGSTMNIRRPVNVPITTVLALPFPRYSDISAKNCEFSPLNPYLMPSLRGFPLELCNIRWAQKLEWWGFQIEKNVDDAFSRFHTHIVARKNHAIQVSAWCRSRSRSANGIRYLSAQSGVKWRKSWRCNWGLAQRWSSGLMNVRRLLTVISRD